MTMPPDPHESISTKDEKSIVGARYLLMAAPLLLFVIPDLFALWNWLNQGDYYRSYFLEKYGILLLFWNIVLAIWAISIVKRARRIRREAAAIFEKTVTIPPELLKPAPRDEKIARHITPSRIRAGILMLLGATLLVLSGLVFNFVPFLIAGMFLFLGFQNWQSIRMRIRLFKEGIPTVGMIVSIRGAYSGGNNIAIEFRSQGEPKESATIRVPKLKNSEGDEVCFLYLPQEKNCALYFSGIGIFPGEIARPFQPE